MYKGENLKGKTEKYVSRIFVALFIVGILIGGSYSLGIGFSKAQINYSNQWGQTFVGTWDGTNFVGPVDLTFQDNSRYQGTMHNGTFDGEGQFLSVEGWSIDATFNRGKPAKTNAFISSNGDTYVGDILELRPSGEGTFTSVNGWSYSGHWKNGVPDGQGLFRYQDGSKYNGEFVAGLAEGEGEYSGCSIWQYSGGFYGG
ncbi:hypothetical protein FACS1894104_5420 [Actinomycetota bacterium]|nr:hypothetical protein FACS1894104_5420 [Actinomycetota bacterium]